MARLTIPDEVTSATFTVTTLTTTFPFTFAIFEKADLRVLHNNVDLAQSAFTLTGTLLEGGGYQGGSVVLNTGVSTGKITLLRKVTPQRAEGFGAVTSVPVRSVDQALNRQMAIGQDLKAVLDRAVVANVGDAVPTAADVLNAATLAAGKADKTLGNATLTQSAGFAAARPLIAKQREFLSVEDWDASGRSDDFVIQKALLSLAETESTLEMRGLKSRTILEPLTVPAKATWSGPLGSADTPLATYDFDAGVGVLKIDPSVSISFGNEARVANWRAIRRTLDVPFASAVAARAGIDAFTGTAFTNASTGMTMENVQILGFAQAFHSTVGQRVQLRGLKIDCTNGVLINESADVSWVTDCEAWPFLTANQSWTADDLLTLARAGQAFKWTGLNDWFNATNCFSYGYFVGFNCEGGDHGTFLNCAADNVYQLAVSGGSGHLARAQSTIGFKVGAGSRNTTITNGRAAAQGRGYLVETTGDYPHVALVNPRAWGSVVRHVHHVSGTMTLDDHGGLEPRSAADIAGGYPDGHVILVEDTATSASIRLSGPNRPTLAGSAAALAKTTVVTDTSTRLANINSPRFPLLTGGMMRVGDVDASESSGDEFGNLRASFGFYNNSMTGEGTFQGDGTQWVAHVGGLVPTSPAPPFSEQKGGLYVSVRSGRESNNTASFSDLTGIQVNTNIIAGTVEGRAYSMHLNNTIDAGANGQAVGLEIELNQVGGIAQPNLFATDQKNLLQLIPIGKMATKTINFGINTGGSHNVLMYVEPGHVREALATPVAYATGPVGTDYGGAFFRAGNVYSQTRVGTQVVEAIGHVQPRYAENLVRHILKPTLSDAYDLWEMPTTGGNGWLSTNYVVTGTFAKAVGLDRTSREYRISNAENLSDANTLIGTTGDYVNFFGPSATARARFVKTATEMANRLTTDAATGQTYFSAIRAGVRAWSFGIDHASTEFRIAGIDGLGSSLVLTALPDRVGWFGQTGAAGGSNHHATALGTAPTSVSSGAVWWFDSAGDMKFQVAGFPVRTVTFT